MLAAEKSLALLWITVEFRWRGRRHATRAGPKLVEKGAILLTCNELLPAAWYGTSQFLSQPALGNGGFRQNNHSYAYQNRQQRHHDRLSTHCADSVGEEVDVKRLTKYTEDGDSE